MDFINDQDHMVYQQVLSLYLKQRSTYKYYFEYKNLEKELLFFLKRS